MSAQPNNFIEGHRTRRDYYERGRITCTCSGLRSPCAYCRCESLRAAKFDEELISMVALKRTLGVFIGRRE